MFLNQCKKQINNILFCKHNNQLKFNRTYLFHSSSYTKKEIDEIREEKNIGSRNSIVEKNQINISDNKNNINNNNKKQIDLNSPKV
jgi:hypothetical protein